MTNGLTEPTVQDVANLLRARTQDSNDQEVGTFTPDTRPTDAEVQGIIDMSGNLLGGTFGDLSTLPCAEATMVRNSASNFWILLAAMITELSYFPEQVKDNRSPYDQFKELYDSLLPYLVSAVRSCQAGGEVPPIDEVGGEQFIPPSDASWAFAVDEGGLVGWETKW